MGLREEPLAVGQTQSFCHCVEKQTASGVGPRRLALLSGVRSTGMLHFII